MGPMPRIVSTAADVAPVPLPPPAPAGYPAGPEAEEGPLPDEEGALSLLEPGARVPLDVAAAALAVAAAAAAAAASFPPEATRLRIVAVYVKPFWRRRVGPGCAAGASEAAWEEGSAEATRAWIKVGLGAGPAAEVAPDLAAAPLMFPVAPGLALDCGESSSPPSSTEVHRSGRKREGDVQTRGSLEGGGEAMVQHVRLRAAEKGV